MELNAFNHPWTYEVSHVCPPPTLVLLFLSLLVYHHKRPCHGYFGRLGGEGSPVAAFKPLGAQRCVL